MDKLKLIFDIIEHPYNYTEEQLAEILSDSESKEIYKLLCKTDSAIVHAEDIDIDAEWENFSMKHGLNTLRHVSRPRNIAASIAIIAGTSIVVIAAGIAGSLSVNHNKPQSMSDTTSAPYAEAATTDSVTTMTDTVKELLMPVLFEDKTLEIIMKEISETYNVEVRFNNNNAAGLRLYYRLDPSLPLSEVLEQLNTFEQININRNETTLTIN